VILCSCNFTWKVFFSFSVNIADTLFAWSAFVLFVGVRRIIIIIIIQHLYSALKSCKGYGGAGGFRLRLSKQVFFKGV